MAEHLPPVRRQIVVPVPPPVAFDAWTSQIGLWWPSGTEHSVYADGSAVKFVDGQLVEEGTQGRSIWGSVLAWEPPGLLRMTWHPGRPETEFSDLSVRFAPVGDGSRTLVTLEHSGWERFDDPLGYRDGYHSGWAFVAGHYERHVTPDEPLPSSDAEVWLMLAHTPGVHAPAGEAIFAHPDFREHLAFVGGLQDAGVLVGAGPIAATAGDGMTIIKVPAGVVDAYVRRAQEEDRSIVRGLLQVSIGVWGVRMHS